tara:strand:+ start:355 stop:657 length:303 start_codon:yes stop_codon:yes gene_type:complete
MSEPIDEKDDKMTEQQYIEMSNHLKETYDKISEKLFRSEIKIIDLKKDLITVYGLVRIIDNILDNLYEVPHEVVVLIECLRSHLSDVMDKELFNINDEYV